VITFVSGEYPPDVGGVGDYTEHLRTSLAEAGQQTRVLSRSQVGRWNARGLVRLLRHTPITGFVHIQYQAAAFDLLGDICLVPGLLRVLRPGVRTLTTFHDLRVPYLFPRAGALRPAAIRLLARTSEAVIAADQRDLELLRAACRSLHHVPIGSNVACAPPDDFDRAAFRRALGVSRDELVVVYFGLLNASKGLELLLSTFERIVSCRRQTRFWLLGGAAGASDPTDLSTAARLSARIEGLGTRVMRTGWLPPRTLSAYLLAGDVALLPYADGASARRGSLLACAEHGLPLVSTQPASEEVAPYIYAVEPDVTRLAAAVLAAGEERTALARRARTLASQMSWPRIAAAHLAIYKQLLYSRP
jgi:glycosyltransferase involved in cell wall biosynthesis